MTAGPAHPGGGRERLGVWYRSTALMSFAVRLGLAALGTAGLVVTGLLAPRPVALVARGAAGFFLAVWLSGRPGGVEVVRLLRRRRVPWSGLDRLQAASPAQ